MRHRYFEARVATCSSNEISVLLSHLYIISVLLSHLYIKMNILPRQARDKHSENSKKEWRFVRGLLGDEGGVAGASVAGVRPCGRHLLSCDVTHLKPTLTPTSCTTQPVESARSCESRWRCAAIAPPF